MTETMIPALDPAPLPGPPWLFHLLWLVTFTIHLLFVNAVLGGTLLAAVYPASRKGSREARVLFVEVNSWAISLAVTFGIAPLLFMQVVLGRFFYSATILIAWAWLGMLGLLTVGYYLNYVAKFRLRAGRDAALPIWLAAVCFVGIAVIQVTVNLLHMRPERWGEVATGAWAALADPTFVPRLLHFLLAAVAMAGALAAFVAVRRAGRGGDAESNRAMAGFGIRAALIATVLQLADGFWLLLALPEGVLRSLMRSGALTMVPLTLGSLGGLGLLVLLAQLGDPVAQATKVRRVAELIVATVILMVITRHQVRGFYLDAHRAGEQVVVASQWGVLALFLVIFVLCVGLTVFAVVRAVNDRPAPGERAA
jgi:heme/copper-type cytochrome/quinol oxidase subunit 4